MSTKSCEPGISMAIERRLDRGHRYVTSGRSFSSYYPWICTECGDTMSNARLLRDDHSCEDHRRLCRERPEFLAHAVKRLAEHTLRKMLK
jgi:hypothetical protein